MILQAHPTGNAFVRALASGLADARMLAEFHTCLDCPADERWLNILPGRFRSEARRRRLPDAVKPYAHLHPWRELGRLGAARLGATGLLSHEKGCFSVDQVYQALDRKVSARLTDLPNLKGVYLYEDGAAAGFAAAQKLGLHTFYDLPIGYWRMAARILGEEAELSPEWAGTLSGLLDSPAKLARKDEELARAGTVFVASSFTRASLVEAPQVPNDVVIIPYGASSPPSGASFARRKPGEPLRVLFVGSLGQRKGTRYLLEAMAALGAGFELTLIGTVPDARCDPLASALRKHRHIPSLPHSAILDEMTRHHVFVFPSLFEGFGLVLLEAMACGLPVIATPHTAAPDIVSEGREGFIVPIRNSAAIADRLTWFAEHEDLRQQMSSDAQRRASEFTWENYTRRIIATIDECLTSRASSPVRTIP